MAKIFIADKPTLDQIKADTGKLVKLADTGAPPRYGFRINMAEPNPDHRVEYIYDAVGMTPARMVFSEQRFEFGSWHDIWFVKKNKPCMVNPDGTVAYEMNPMDYFRKADNDEATDVGEYAGNMNAMAAMPLVWVKRWNEGGYRCVSFCETRFDESYQAYAHTRPDGSVADFAYGAMFSGLVDRQGRLRSIANFDVTGSLTAQQQIDAAKKNGAGWGIRNWAFWNLIHDLLILMGKSTDLQNTFGKGHTNRDPFLLTGTLARKGAFFGYATNEKNVKVFHMEGFWGGPWERLTGAVLDHGTYKVKMYPGDGGYNLTGEGYEVMGKGIQTPTQSEEFGTGCYVSRAVQTPQGLLPMALDGSDSTYECDAHRYNNSIVSVPIVGGHDQVAGQTGRNTTFFYGADYQNQRLGACLSLEDPK